MDTVLLPCEKLHELIQAAHQFHLVHQREQVLRTTGIFEDAIPSSTSTKYYTAAGAAECSVGG